MLAMMKPGFDSAMTKPSYQCMVLSSERSSTVTVAVLGTGSEPVISRGTVTACPSSSRRATVRRCRGGAWAPCHRPCAGESGENRGEQEIPGGNLCKFGEAARWVPVRSRIGQNRRAGSDAGPGPGGAAVGQAFTVDRRRRSRPRSGYLSSLMCGQSARFSGQSVRRIRTSAGPAPCRTPSCCSARAGTHLRPCGLSHAWRSSQPLEESIPVKRKVTPVDGRWVSGRCQPRCTSRPMASRRSVGLAVRVGRVGRG